MGNSLSRQNLIVRQSVKDSLFGPKHSILKPRGSLHSIDTDCEDCPCCREECDCAIYDRPVEKKLVKTVTIKEETELNKGKSVIASLQALKENAVFCRKTCLRFHLCFVCFFFITEEAVSPSVAAFDVIVSGPLAAYVQCSKGIGGDVSQHAEAVQQGFK